MKIVFLGTNGWYDTETGNTACVLIETEKEYLILDAGNGLFKADRYIENKKKPIYLFLSHFHLDHIIGLHTLNKFSFPQGINIYGPPGLKKAIKTIINSPYSFPVNKLETKVRLHELQKYSQLPVEGHFLKLKHSSLCYGYRLNIENKVLTYCTDTGRCSNLLKLANNADSLILECSYKLGQKDLKWPHLNPQESAFLAKKSRVKKLYLMHFDSSVYQSLVEREKAGIIARKIFRNTVATRDGMKVSL